MLLLPTIDDAHASPPPLEEATKTIVRVCTFSFSRKMYFQFVIAGASVYLAWLNVPVTLFPVLQRLYFAGTVCACIGDGVVMRTMFNPKERNTRLPLSLFEMCVAAQVLFVVLTGLEYPVFFVGGWAVRNSTTDLHWGVLLVLMWGVTVACLQSLWISPAVSAAWLVSVAQLLLAMRRREALWAAAAAIPFTGNYQPLLWLVAHASTFIKVIVS